MLKVEIIILAIILTLTGSFFLLNKYLESSQKKNEAQYPSVAELKTESISTFLPPETKLLSNHENQLSLDIEHTYFATLYNRYQTNLSKETLFAKYNTQLTSQGWQEWKNDNPRSKIPGNYGSSFLVWCKPKLEFSVEVLASDSAKLTPPFEYQTGLWGRGPMACEP